MTKEQVAWASKHDWFQFEARGRVYVYELVVKNSKIVSEKTIYFTDYQKLRDWAGYQTNRRI